MARAAGPRNSSGMPPGVKFYSPFPFSGMNTQATPVAISDQEFVWLENWIRLGDGKLRTAPDAGTPLYSSGGNQNIVYFFAYSLGLELYFAVFLSNGSAVQVHYPSGAVTNIGPAGTFYSLSNPTSLPDCVQWGVQYLLISNNNTSNDYWIWDGELLYKSGSAAPNGVTLLSGGSNYNLPPTVTAFGGHGSGITFTPIVNAGSVVNVQIDNPGGGYEVGDIVQAQFKGGGSDNGPILEATLQSGGVAAANITANGSGYTSPVVTFSGGGGSGAAGTAIVGDEVSAINVTNGGINYTNATVAITGGGGTGAIAVANINGGVITSIDISDGGSGFTSAPTVTITGNGTGATATATVNNGQIIGINITANGSGYTSAPSITITDGGPGTGATAVATLQSTQIGGVTVVDPGSGFFTNPLIQFEGGGGQNAAGYVRLNGTSVQRIDVVTPGSGYTNIPTVFELPGSGGNNSVRRSANLNGTGGVSSISVTNGGSGYQTPPNFAILNAKGDTTGNGATVQSILNPVPINHVVMSNNGVHYTDAPAVIVEPGANNAAYATIEMMPFGLSGKVIETYLQRVWIANPAPSQFDTLPPQGDFAVTAPGSLTDVATSDGGVLFTNADGFLQRQYVGCKQSNGYLYFVGDGSVSVVSGVQTSAAGSPPVTTTTFNYQTVDPQVGGAWRDAIQDFGRNILIANQTGVFALIGGSASKVSDKMDDVFLKAEFPPVSAITPSAAIAHIYNVKHYLMLTTVQDPDTFQYRTVMLTWNGREWSITSQSPNLTFIGPQKRGSKFYAWGTDGTNLYPLFSTPSAIPKRLDTKYYGANNPLVVKEVQRFYMQAQDQTTSGVAAEVTFNVSGVATQVDGSESVPTQVYNVSSFNSEGVTQEIVAMLVQENPAFEALVPGWPMFGTATGGIPAINVGLTLLTTSPDFILSHLVLAYTDAPAMY